MKVRVVDVQTDPCQMVMGLGCLGDQLRSDRWLKEFPDRSGLFPEAENTQKTGILMISPCIQIIAPVVQNDMERHRAIRVEVRFLAERSVINCSVDKN